MRKSELISKYDHQLRLKNYSENTLKAYLNGGKYFASSIQTLMRKHRKICGINKKATPHTLRHRAVYPDSFGTTHLLDNGTDTKFIQELPGHKHISATQIYTRVSSRTLKDVQSPIENFKV